ncbi:hypothetical protein F5Y17DRAFT_454147 [Xylariaceae sp. FL0594]|nr:hypothetical protein F5Y17DRAFT_454147 [Xylariaceae sp. FL0594]
MDHYKKSSRTMTSTKTRDHGDLSTTTTTTTTLTQTRTQRMSQTDTQTISQSTTTTQGNNNQPKSKPNKKSETKPKGSGSSSNRKRLPTPPETDLQPVQNTRQQVVPRRRQRQHPGHPDDEATCRCLCKKDTYTGGHVTLVCHLQQAADGSGRWVCEGCATRAFHEIGRCG